MTDTTRPPSPRRAAKDIRGFVNSLRNLSEFADSLDDAWTAESAVQAAKNELGAVESQIAAAKDRASAAEAEALRREQVAAERVAKADQEAADAIARFAAQQEVEIAKVTNAAAARIAASSAKAEAAEKAASDAEARLAKVVGDLDTANSRRASAPSRAGQRASTSCSPVRPRLAARGDPAFASGFRVVRHGREALRAASWSTNTMSHKINLGSNFRVDKTGRIVRSQKHLDASARARQRGSKKIRIVRKVLQR